MKKCLTVMGLFGLGISQLQAAPYAITDMEAVSMGGAGVASANQYLSLSNPSLVSSNLRSSNDFLMIMGGHFFRHDNDEFQDGLDLFQSSKTAANLQAINGRSMIHHWAGSAGVVLHNPKGSTKLYVAGYSYTTATVSVDPADLIGTPASYNSTVKVSGLSIVETGLTFAKQQSVPGLDIGDLELAITGKVMNGKIHDFTVPVDTADVDGLYAEGTTTQRLNLDLSAAKELGRVWSFGLVARNIVPHKFKNENGSDVQIGPQIRGGVTFHGRNHYLALDADLTQNRPVADFGRTQMVSGGFGYELGKHATIRTGVGHDLAGTYPNTYAVGIGLHGEYLHFMGTVMASDAGLSGLGLQGAIGF